MRVLVIEDEKQVAESINRKLRSEGLVVETAADGEEGEFLAATEDFDAIVLDINLPKMNGWEVLKRLRDNQNTTPILILTAYGDVEDRVKGLNLGADDYLPKPFALEELYARVQSLIRRDTQNPAPQIKIGKLTIDPLAHRVWLDDEEVELPTKEFAVLEYLARNRGAVVTRLMIMEHVWGSEFETVSNVVDVYIKNLRQKLGTQLIRTVRGKGYIIEDG